MLNPSFTLIISKLVNTYTSLSIHGRGIQKPIGTQYYDLCAINYKKPMIRLGLFREWTKVFLAN